MSIASELNRLLQAKNDLATAITNKGVTVPADSTLDEYAALVDSIQTGGGSPTLLPTGYTQLDWIQNTSDAIIDTGIIGTGNTTFKLRVRVDNVTNTSSIFGARTTTTSNCLVVSKSNNKFNFGYNTSSLESNITIVAGQWYDIELNDGKFYVDEVQVDSRSTASFTTPYNLHLFGAVGTRSNVRTYYYGICSFGISYINNRMFVPCTNPGGIVGMYDVTYSCFFPSVNSTPFVAGTVTV